MLSTNHGRCIEFTQILIFPVSYQFIDVAVLSRRVSLTFTMSASPEVYGL